MASAPGGARGQAGLLGPDAGAVPQGVVKRPSRGWPRVRPNRVVGDQADTGRWVRGELRQRGIGTRDEKLAETYHALLTIFCILP